MQIVNKERFGKGAGVGQLADTVVAANILPYPFDMSTRLSTTFRGVPL